MFKELIYYLEIFENILWGYIGVPVIIILGVYLTYRSNFFQIRSFPHVLTTFFQFFKSCNEKKGIHPLKAFFACVGGCIGVGNIVGICTAVQIGGPGALFWIWITAGLGMIIKYAEVYLGIRHRIVNKEGRFEGGPMYFLQKISKRRWLPVLVCFLLCIYGVEVYQFSVITESLKINFNIDRIYSAIVLLFFVIYAGLGGIKRVGNISSAIIPFFVFLYLSMGIWVLANNLTALPLVLKDVFTNAFTGSSATGGFLGSTIIMTMSQGVRRGCYTADVGIGYASIIHSESAVESPAKQASLVVLDVFIDTFLICSMSIILVLVTGAWQQPMESSTLIQNVFSKYFPYTNYFMPLFLLLLGYSTLIAFFSVGILCAKFISRTKGSLFYTIFAGIFLFCSAFFDTIVAQMLMSISGGLLLALNCFGIFCLRNEISYKIEKEKQLVAEAISN